MAGNYAPTIPRANLVFVFNMFQVLFLIFGTKICLAVSTRQEDFKLNFVALKNPPGEDEDDEDTYGGCEDDLGLRVQGSVTETISLSLVWMRELS